MKLRIGLVTMSLILSVLIGLSLSLMTNGNDKGESEADNRLLIGLSMDTLKEARLQRDRDIFVARAEEMGARVLVESANSDDSRQIRDVQALLSNDVDVLVIVPHNGKAMAKAVNIAHEAGIAVIAYDRMITDCDLDLYISFDNVKVGAMQAKYLVEHLSQNRKSRIVRVFGAKTDNNAFLVKQGQDNILAPFLEKEQTEVIHADWADNWSPAMAKKITNAAITQQGSRFDAILASNDGTAGGAIQALMEEGLAGKILVTGQDADLVACQRIAVGTQAMSIYKPIRRLATHAAEVAVKMSRGEPVIAAQGIYNGKVEVPSILLNVTVVTRENLQETVIADLFHTYDDVYRNIPEQQRPRRE